MNVRFRNFILSLMMAATVELLLVLKRDFRCYIFGEDYRRCVIMDKEPLMFQIEVTIFLVAFVGIALYPVVRYLLDSSYRRKIQERAVYEREHQNDLMFRLMGYHDDGRLVRASVHLKVCGMFAALIISHYFLVFWYGI